MADGRHFEIVKSPYLSENIRFDLIHTLRNRQLRFLGHLLRSGRALYEPAGGRRKRGRPRTNYITYIQ